MTASDSVSLQAAIACDVVQFEALAHDGSREAPIAATGLYKGVKVTAPAE